MATARDLVRQALTDLRVLGANDDLQDHDLALGFETLNQWVTDLETQQASVFYVKREVFSLVANTASYTIGPGGTFNTIRPLIIDEIAIIIDRTATPPVESYRQPPLPRERWQAIPNKAQTSSAPTTAHYDRAFESTGLGRIHVWPIPTTSVVDLVLYLPRPMQKFADYTTNYAFPPGFERAIRKNLAVELADAFDVDPSPRLAEAAVRSLANIRRSSQRRPKELKLDAALVGRGGYNIYTDQ